MKQFDELKDSNLDDYSKALVYASMMHAHVNDKGGRPYIDHPIRVSQYCTSINAKIVAILHDVVEDTDATLDTLLMLGFSVYVVDGVDAVTRRDGESYDDFINRACRNDIGREVKKADIKDNTDPKRLHYLPKEKQNRLVTKYAKALNTIRQFELLNYNL